MIKVLDKFVADKIAAGEVIERPVSAVKELLENAIDAGAHSIIVEIRGGGKSYIRVTDDGCGIPADEIETAFLRHATSKISNITDLDNIGSLGFRGEALASIAAVSKITIVSKTHNSNAGVRMMLHGGRVIAKETAGANAGTTIIAEDLFYNTPARRKFMGSDAREGSAVIELIQQYAVCYPSVKFMMIRNGETVFTTIGDGNTLQTIRTIYPDTDHAALIPVSGRNVEGYVSDPGTTKSTRRGQLFFVNGRLVVSKVIEKGIESGYGGRIFSGYPVVILFITADPSEIDVNIHPGKREIRFLRPAEVTDDISEAISKAMIMRDSVPAGLPARKTVEESAPSSSALQTVSAQGSITGMDFKTVSSASLHVSDDTTDPAASVHDQNGIQGADILADEPSSHSAQAATQNDSSLTVASDRHSDFSPMYTGEQSSIRDYLSNLRRDTGSRKTEADESQGISEDTEEESGADTGKSYSGMTAAMQPPVNRPFSFDELEYKGYLFDTFIVMQSADTVYLFDQHAAHERIFYEQFTSHYMDGRKFTQPILMPLTINVSADVYYMSREWLEPLTDAGYDIEDFGASTFMIRGIPSYMELSEAESFARSYLEALDEYSGSNQIVIDKLIMRSCKSAVKANEHLSQMEINDLISKLSKCSNPYCCPHGRPTFIRYTRFEIEKSFKRK